MAENKVHPATIVSNIKACIPITLDYEGKQYNSWSTLFQLHCRANMVINHIQPLTVNPSVAVPAPKESEKALTQRLDDIVRQWIYGTISNDLLNSILDPDDSAVDAWNRLQQFFLNNKSARALQFDAQFTNTKLAHFDGVKSYCAKLKTLADNLRNVGDKVSDNRMALQLLKGLSEEYKSFRTSVRHLNPLPSFDTLRSMLELEEHENAADLSIESHVEAHITQSHLSSQNNADNSHYSSRGNNQRNGGNGQKTTKGKGSSGKGKGASGNQQCNGGASQQQQNPQRGPTASHQQKTQAGWMYPPPWAYWQQGPWAPPPCPYPS
ncbi:uncharacterized protein LOC124909741 [Impatiens glandulifera]|uniref:uncharacterized protein LOC124909741 n=1 Tax=Impatiens glandulifera TaxID=253017 RepID=UPI001FB05C12|nr:uncharacterized protein LOC124909741 [Impatiens glandulifera]